METMFPNLSTATTSDPEILHLRKELTALFADYDAVAKRIRSLPCPPSPGNKNEDISNAGTSAQERVQIAVWTRAVNFMQMHVGLLQVPVHALRRLSFFPHATDLFWLLFLKILSVCRNLLATSIAEPLRNPPPRHPKTRK